MRFLSLMLAMGTVLASVLPSAGQRVLAVGASSSAAERLVAHYKFDGDFNDTSSDSTGTAEGGTAPTLVSDSIRGQVMKSGSGKSWIRTNNPLYGKETLDGFTVGAWVKANTVDTWLGIWSISSGAGGSGSHGIVVWESDDLVNWSEPWIAEIAPENAGCTWAPEFIYDAMTGEYVVYWSATTIELNESEEITQEYENHAIYYAKTRDFRTFTEPVLYHAGGEDSSGKRIKVIDSTMIEDDGKYYRYTKNESRGVIEIDVADSVLGTFTPIASTALSTTLPSQQGAVEGPIIFKLNKKDGNGNDQWCLMVDRFARGQGYYPLITTDLNSGEFTLLNNSDFSMPSKYRHGYVMPVTAAEYDALQRAFGEDDYVSTLKLEEALKAANAIDTALLTDESASVLTAGIAAAQNALKSATTTAAADEAAAALQAILDTLTYCLTQVEVTAPTKTAYTQGEALDTTGMVVTATYGDGSTADVTALATVSGYDAGTTGTQTVTVTYTENGVTKTDTFTVTVQAAVEEPVAVTGVTLNTNTVTLTVGQSTLLIATVAPEDATNRNVRWTSSDSTIAAVYSNGTVMAGAEDTPREIVLEKSDSGNPMLGFDANGDILYGGDPSILVDGDTVYCYVGHDASAGEYYSMPDWRCYSTTDMKTWKYESTIMTMQDISWRNDNVSAWASQVAKGSDGKYYFYYCAEGNASVGRGKCIGVAMSNSAKEPFKDIRQPLVRNIDTPNGSHSWEDIDPTVWIETDEAGVEHRYLGWGNNRFFVCELNADMTSIKDRDGDPNTLSVGYYYEGATPNDIVVGQMDGMEIFHDQDKFDGHAFTEAPYYYRQQDENGNFYGPYYMFFACDWREQMAYATTDDIMTNS